MTAPHKLSQNQLRERDSRNLWRGIFKGKLIDDTVDALNSKKSLSLWRILRGKQYPVAAHFITSPKPDNTDVDPQWTDELGHTWAMGYHTATRMNYPQLHATENATRSLSTTDWISNKRKKKKTQRKSQMALQVNSIKHLRNINSSQILKKIEEKALPNSFY